MPSPGSWEKVARVSVTNEGWRSLYCINDKRTDWR